MMDDANFSATRARAVRAISWYGIQLVSPSRPCWPFPAAAVGRI